MTTAHDDYLKLCEKVRQAQVDYHTHDKPTISDYDYDQLVAQVRKLEAEHPEWVSGGSVVDNVGASIKRGLYAVKHDPPMLSLDNVFTVAELQDWMDGLNLPPGTILHCSYKYDGLACKLSYIDRRLIEAATRGDRYEGESILHNVVGFDSIPKSLRNFAPDDLEIRGELLMFNDEFVRYNERLAARGMKPSINPRNAAAGIARRLDRERLPGAQLVFFPYAVIHHDGEVPSDYIKDMEQIYQHGFEHPWLPPQFAYDKNEPLALLDYVDARQKERDTLPFGIDGLVFRVIDYAKCEELGFTSRAPRWAIAYKFPPEEKTTIVRNIRLQIGRTGNATPVAETDPVLVGGVTVTNATLHNEDHINRLDLAIGDTVMIRRAGDVVPEIAAVLHRPEDRVVWKFPEQCECGAPIVRYDGQANHICTGGINCQFQRQRAFEHFVSRDAFDIEGVGPELVADLIAAGKLRKFADFYYLTKEDLLAVSSESSERFAENVLASIAKSRKTTLQRFLYALGIPMAGQGTAKRLADWFGSLEMITGTSPALLKAVPDIGEAVAQSIDGYFAKDQSWQELLKAGVEITDEMGPSPDFARYADPVELLTLSGIKGLTPKRAPEVRRLLGLIGWPQAQSDGCGEDRCELPVPEDLKEEVEKAQAYYQEHEQTLRAIANDWCMVVSNLKKVRQISNNRPLVGNTYVITGGFDETLGSRQKIAAELEALGAKVSGSVSNKTTAVIVGDSPGANKLDKAKELHVPTMYVQDLKDLLAKHSE